MKTTRKDQLVPGDTRNRGEKPNPKMMGGFGEEEDADPKETDYEDDDNTGSNEKQDENHPHRSNP